MRFSDWLGLIFKSIVYIFGVGISLLVLLLIASFFPSIFDIDNKNSMNIAMTIIIVISLFSGPFLAYNVIKIESHCKICNLNWVLNKDGQTTISETERTEVVQKHHEDEENKRKIVTTRIYWQHYKCSKCEEQTKYKCTSESSSAEF
jgi:hypothetical protein